MEVIKTEKGYEVRVAGGKNVDVFVNNECIYSEYDNDAYKYVPVSMRDFVKKHSYDIGVNDNGDIKGTYAEVNVAGRDLTMYFPKNKTKKVHARYSITDPLETVLERIDDYEFKTDKVALSVKDKITTMYNEMLTGLKELGFELIYSHSACESFWGWHDLTFKPADFNQEQFTKASKVIFKYDTEFTKLLKKYHIL